MPAHRLLHPRLKYILHNQRLFPNGQRGVTKLFIQAVAFNARQIGVLAH